MACCFPPLLASRCLAAVVEDLLPGYFDAKMVRSGLTGMAWQHAWLGAWRWSSVAPPRPSVRWVNSSATACTSPSPPRRLQVAPQVDQLVLSHLLQVRSSPACGTQLPRHACQACWPQPWCRGGRQACAGMSCLPPLPRRASHPCPPCLLTPALAPAARLPTCRAGSPQSGDTCRAWMWTPPAPPCTGSSACTSTACPWRPASGAGTFW